MKSEFAIFQFFRRLSQLAYFVKCMRTLLKLNSYRNIFKFRNRKKFVSSLVLVLHKNNCEISTKNVMHVQSFSFANFKNR